MLETLSEVPKRRAYYTRDALNQRLITLEMINKGSRTVSRDTGDSWDKGPLLHLWLEDAWTKLQTTGWLSASQPRSKKLRELNNPRQFDIRLSDAWNSQRSHLSGVWESQAAKSKKMDNGENCVWYGLEWSWRDWTLPQQWSLAKIQRKRLMPVSIFCTWHSEYQDWDWIFDEQEYWFQMGCFRRMRIFWRSFVHLCIPIGYSCGPAEYWSPGGVGYFCTYFV